MKGLFWKAFITVRVGIRLHCSSPLTEHGFLSMDSRCFVNPSVPGRVYPSVRIRGECWFVWVTHSDSILLVSSVQFSYSVVSDSLPPHGLQYARPSLSITNSWSLHKFMSIELVMPSNHLILCHPLLLLPSIFPSMRVFSNESALRFRWPKYWSFSFNISPSNEYSGLISFRMDWLGLLAVQGTLKSLFQHHNDIWPNSGQKDTQGNLQENRASG